MDYDKITREWKKSGLPIPKYPLLVNRGNYYAVIDDSSTIITAASKGRVIYAIAKSKVWIEKGEDFSYYAVDSIVNLKVISCTENTNVKALNRFVFENVLPNI